MSLLYFIFKPNSFPPSNALLYQYFSKAWAGANVALNTARTAKYGDDSSEIQIQQGITRDFNLSFKCLNNNSKIIQVIYYLIYKFSDFDPSTFNFANANLDSLSDDLSFYILEGYNDISQCLNSTSYMGPFLKSIISKFQASNLEVKMATLLNLSSSINSKLFLSQML